MLKKTLIPLAWVLLGAALSTGTAVAATGGSFLLGQSNTAAGTSTLTSTRTPLRLEGPTQLPPLDVAANRTKVAYLNADLLDGLDSTNLQRRLTSSCPDGQALQGVAADGTPSCVVVPRQWIAVVGADGSLQNGSDGVTSGRYLNGAGSYYVQLPAEVSECAWIATAAGGTAATVRALSDPTYVAVQTTKATTATDEPFHLLVTC